jgi:hypothetical protein
MLLEILFFCCVLYFLLSVVLVTTSGSSIATADSPTDPVSISMTDIAESTEMASKEESPEILFAREETANINEPTLVEYKEFKNKLYGLNELFGQIESNFQHPERFIYDYFYNMRLEIELRRETLIEEIHALSAGAIYSNEVFEKWCLSNCRSVIEQRIGVFEECKGRLEALHLLESGVLDDTKLTEILTLNKSNEG